MSDDEDAWPSDSGDCNWDDGDSIGDSIDNSDIENNVYLKQQDIGNGGEITTKIGNENNQNERNNKNGESNGEIGEGGEMNMGEGSDMDLEMSHDENKDDHKNDNNNNNNNDNTINILNDDSLKNDPISQMLISAVSMNSRKENDYGFESNEGISHTPFRPDISQKTKSEKCWQCPCCDVYNSLVVIFKNFSIFIYF